jgi:hypothetical protein
MNGFLENIHHKVETKLTPTSKIKVKNQFLDMFTVKCYFVLYCMHPKLSSDTVQYFVLSAYFIFSTHM